MIQEALLTWRYIDTDSNLIMPWYTLPALKWLKENINYDWNVCEYGAGYSTIWFRLNCRSVYSKETNREWTQAMVGDGDRLDCTYFELPEEKELYIRSGMGSYNCIVIDGDHREDCVKYIFKNNYMLLSGGFLIIDNYGQEDFPKDAVERTEELLKDWTKVVHKQPNHSTWATAIFQKTI